LATLILESPFATALLPIAFRPPVYCSLQSGVNALGCIFLHSRQDVAIKVQRDADLGMPETLACHFGVDTTGEQMSSMGVP